MRPKRSRTHNCLEASTDLPHYPSTEPLSRYEERKSRREFYRANPNRLKSVIGGVALATTIGLSYALEGAGHHIHRDIEAGKEAVRGSHAEIHQVYEYTDEDTVANLHGTFVLTGLGTKNPFGTAEMLQPHQENGDVFAIEYGNEDLDAVDMAKRVIRQAKKNDLRELSFDGYSAGGPIALDIAAYIHQNEPDLHVTSVILNSSPIGEGSLTEVSQRGVEVMNRVLSLYPDFLYYQDGRAMIEIINRNERYLTREDYNPTHYPKLLNKNQFHVGSSLYTIDYESLSYDIEDVRRKMEDTSIASASLIKSQADFITMTDYDTNIKTLSQPGANKVNDTLPLIIYTRSESPHDDQVVDVDSSEKNLVESLNRHRSAFAVLREDIGHANPVEMQSEYHHMIESKISPRINLRLTLGSMKYGQDKYDDKTNDDYKAAKPEDDKE